MGTKSKRKKSPKNDLNMWGYVVAMVISVRMNIVGPQHAHIIFGNTQPV